MEKRQENKIKMTRTVSGVLTSYDEIVQQTPGLSEYHDLLKDLIGETERHTKGQLNTGKEFTQKKKDSRGQLEIGTLKICAALAAFATTTTDSAATLLKSKYQISDSNVTGLRDMPLFAFAYMVYDDALPYADKLAPFATAEDINKLKVLADDFNALLPQKRTQLGQSTVSTKNLEDAIAQIDQLLIEKIDVLVKPWQYTEPDFFNAFTHARHIGDVQYRKSKKDDTSENNA